MLPRFHLAVTVDSLDKARDFYGGILGLSTGRTADTWIDWNLEGHQFVTHLDPNKISHVMTNPVDDHNVPVPHFGLLLSVDSFHHYAGRIKDAGISFIIDPYLRFKDLPGQQWTMFFTDFSGNPLEFKAFYDDADIFATTLRTE